MNYYNIDDVARNNTEDLFTIVGSSTEKIDALSSTPYSYWKETIKQFFKKPSVYICLVLLLLVIFFTIFGTVIKSWDITITPGYQYTDRFGYDELLGRFVAVGPNRENWFGVAAPGLSKEWIGLDMWTLVWTGARLSLLLGLVVAVIESFFGILIGALWGYFPRLDPIMLEFRNFVSNIPSLLIHIMLMQIFAQYMDRYAFIIIVFLLTMLSWMPLAGTIRNHIIIIRHREYNIASQTLGSGAGAMVTHNLLPYIISIIVSQISLSIPGAISSEVGLSYFNLSFKFTQGDITLGQVLTEMTRTTGGVAGVVAPWMDHWWLIVAPLVVLVPITVCFFYLGIALADASDPKKHR